MSEHPPTEGPAYPHFAMIYIDGEGNLCQRSSDSVAENRQDIFSPTVIAEFLRAVARSRESQGAQFHVPIPVQSTQAPSFNQHSSTLPQGGLVVHSGIGMTGEERSRIPTEQGSLPQSAMWPQPSKTWSPQQEQAAINQPRRRHFGGRSLNLSSHQSASISVKEPEILRLYYEKVFQNLQQTNCRVIAKAYIKLVEPRKQVNYPYNGRKTVDGRVQQLDPEVTKPPWWPIGVCHREPDHLPKVERIRLLVHILCDLRESNGVTAARLKECDQPIRRQILPVDRLQILDEMYRVRETEERFLDGILDSEPSVLISRANLPQIIEDASSGQSSPLEPDHTHVAKSECSDDAPRINTSQVIMSAKDLQKRHSYYSPGPYTPTMYPDMQTSPGMQHQTSETSPHASTSPQELKRKRELSSGTCLADRTRQAGMVQYLYPGHSGVQQPMELYPQQVIPQQAVQAVAITQPTAEVLPAELMMPYGYPFYYGC
ncbi:unnamed protein product [Penicillium salamii]|uniref:Subtelomeric hrmA-associated cluster protein AFUB-079030/YDR124W-like helical bundle domain-containing protein n=1 Tax=Penicillium salamii TaxID=1612424 RepID=A0A9W4NNC0_9EURO|nr:unnamed protein product [Penicillium salamii]CAG8394518.1 unnamed protein product [Penicillium salamii]CAG8396843.1 unnamed protein product [Penicillium salamii]CAG8397022.1 unnamed protein product [Penicillium salamii]